MFRYSELKITISVIQGLFLFMIDYNFLDPSSCSTIPDLILDQFPAYLIR
jgi:hypothetical protein